MRNGNSVIPFEQGLKNIVLILPMRNGNYLHLQKESYADSCSYPTYEEWKHSHKKVTYTNGKSSYPTYEEWKLYN